MKRVSLKNLILIGLISFFVQNGMSAFADTEVEQQLLLNAEPAVAIEKDTSLSRESGSVNVQNGTHEGLHTVFTLQTNETDDDYDFVITSSIATGDGMVSAYANDGSILFGHSFEYPTNDAIANAKLLGNSNRNVIVYPVTIVTTGNLTSSYQAGNAQYGDCYVIKLNGSTSGNVSHFVMQSPKPGTYSVGQDAAGSYQATITFSAISK